MRISESTGNEMKRYFIYLLFVVLLAARLQAEGLYVDFCTSSYNVEAGYEGYLASHEQPSTFTTQTYSAFDTTISIIPTWAFNEMKACSVH